MARLLHILIPLVGIASLRAEESPRPPDPGRFRLPPADTAAPFRPAPGTFDLPAFTFGPGLPDPAPMDAEKAHRDSVIAHFPEYWAKVEQATGWDGELDWRRLYGEGGQSMRLRGPADAYVRIDPGRGLSFDLTAIGRDLAEGWKQRTAERERTERFRKRASALIGLARDLQAAERKDAIGVSFIVARLGFMARRVTENKVPPRPDRARMASELKAWAGHPEFAATALGPALAELCSLYVDYR